MLIIILKEARNSCLALVHRHSKYMRFRCKYTLGVGVSLFTPSEKTKEALAGFESFTLILYMLLLIGKLKWDKQNIAFVCEVLWLLSECSASKILRICWKMNVILSPLQAGLAIINNSIQLIFFFFSHCEFCQQLTAFFFFLNWNLISLSALRWQLFLSNCSRTPCRN